VALWRDAGAPFESALAQSVLAEAYLRNADPAMARMELETAHNAFVALGALWHAQRAQDALARMGAGDTPTPVLRTFVFTDVVNSTPLLAAMGDEAWASVLRWHDSTIRTQLARWNGKEVKQRGGGDGFFAVFTDPRQALQCAMNIQMEFARHRATHGFAPELRIGVHQAEALDVMGDYAGRGVHEAARIAELARGGQILASRSTAGDVVTEGTPMQVELRGLPGTTDVVEVRWSEGASKTPR
jgi:class 3 adenylate cyclase